MAYKVIILYRLYMPPYFLGTFTEYPVLIDPIFTFQFCLGRSSTFAVLTLLSF